MDQLRESLHAICPITRPRSPVTSTRILFLDNGRKQLERGKTQGAPAAERQPMSHFRNLIAILGIPDSNPNRFRPLDEWMSFESTLRFNAEMHAEGQIIFVALRRVPRLKSNSLNKIPM